MKQSSYELITVKLGAGCIAAFTVTFYYVFEILHFLVIFYL